jgi:Organic solute transporter Ostalpha
MKIACLIPFYSILSTLSVCFPKAHVYLDPWLEVFQSVALGSFFLLMCEFVSPSEKQRDVFFAALKVPDKKAGSGTRDGLIWYRVSPAVLGFLREVPTHFCASVNGS